MNMLKSFFIISLAIYSNNIFSNGLLINDPILHLIDGKPHMIDEYAIKDTMEVKGKTKIVLFGKPGRYEVDGKKYNLVELAKLEEELGETAEIKSALSKVKEDYHKITTKFEKRMTENFGFIEKLILKSCEMRNRNDSYLIKWAGDPQVNVYRDLNTVHEFKTFCTDLVNFFDDILESCPNGRAKYHEKFGVKK